MPHKKKATRQQKWTRAHRDQLRTGWDFLGQAWHGGKWRSFDATDYPPEVCADMLNCWQEHRAEILADTPAGKRPHGWWLFDSPARRDEEVEEVRQLYELGIMPPEEIEEIRRQAVEADRTLHVQAWCGQKFRRSWVFWTFVSDQARDPSRFESSQLLKMGALTTGEKLILDSPQEAVNGVLGLWCPQNFYYMSQPERKLLGLDTKGARAWDADCTKEAATTAAITPVS